MLFLCKVIHSEQAKESKDLVDGYNQLDVVPDAVCSD